MLTALVGKRILASRSDTSGQRGPPIYRGQVSGIMPRLSTTRPGKTGKGGMGTATRVGRNSNTSEMKVLFRWLPVQHFLELWVTIPRSIIGKPTLSTKSIERTMQRVDNYQKQKSHHRVLHRGTRRSTHFYGKERLQARFPMIMRINLIYYLHPISLRQISRETQASKDNQDYTETSCVVLHPLYPPLLGAPRP